MLLTQIPSADALVKSNTKEAIDSIERSKLESQNLISFCSQIREQVKSLIDSTNRESSCLTRLSSILSSKNEEIAVSLCPSHCYNCSEDKELRKGLSLKLKAVNETTETNVCVIFYSFYLLFLDRY